MKKFFCLLTVLLLAAAAPLSVLAEETDLMNTFEGIVTEVFEGGFLMETTEMGLIQVNTDENTVMDGILSIEPIAAGQYVIVDTNGMMTRSLPPQVYGMRVGCYTLNGVAGEITEEGVLLTGDPIFGDVFVQMTPTMANVFPGVPMLVYYDGVMTMSLPGKVNARYVLVPELTGVVSEKDGAGFTLTDEAGSTYLILTSDSLLVGQLAANEEEPLPGSPEAEALIAEDSETPVDETIAEETVTEETATETAEETAEVTADADSSANPDVLHDETIPTGDSTMEAAIQWGDGDTVTVYHQGPLEAEAGNEVIALGMLVHR